MVSSLSKVSKGMYFDKKVATLFAEREQNEKNFRVAAIIDKLAINEVSHIKDPLYISELGGGAHPDRYDQIFERLSHNAQSKIDWVDISPVMLDLAKKYIINDRKRSDSIRFVESDILDYLQRLSYKRLDLAIMKYTFNHIKDLSGLIMLLSDRLKRGASLVSTITTLSPELKSISTNARFLYRGKEFPENKTKTLKEGEEFGVRFFKESGNPSKGYLPGAENIQYYHSKESIESLAKEFGFVEFLGDWKKYLPKSKQNGETLDQDILILKKK